MGLPIAQIISVSLAALSLGVTASPLVAGEFAVLANGSRLHAVRHELRSGTVRLHDQNGFTELPSDLVIAYEPDGSTAQTSAPAIQQASGVTGEAPMIDQRRLVRDAAMRTGLPPAFVESVALVESALRPDAVSPRGAIGVMQLMPATARFLAVDPNDPAQNVDGGARLLRELLIRYDGDVVKALSAYNAGSGAVDRYRGMPPYVETQLYVNKVIRAYIKAGGR